MKDSNPQYRIRSAACCPLHQWSKKIKTGLLCSGEYFKDDTSTYALLFLYESVDVFDDGLPRILGPLLVAAKPMEYSTVKVLHHISSVCSPHMGVGMARRQHCICYLSAQWSGMRESNPRLKLGRLLCYLYTNTAYGARRRNRTANLLITNQLRYQLRHAGLKTGDATDY